MLTDAAGLSPAQAAPVAAVPTTPRPAEPATDPDVERKLHALESAAASAIYNGATPEQARARVEVGIAEAVEVQRRTANGFRDA